MMQYTPLDYWTFEL